MTTTTDNLPGRLMSRRSPRHTEGLSLEMKRFLAYRLNAGSDSEAATAAGVPVASATAWKTRCPSFADAYCHLGDDHIAFARSLLRDGLASAALTLVDSLQSVDRYGSADNAARITAAKALLATHGIAVEKSYTDSDSVIRVELVDATERRPLLSVGSVEAVVREIAPADAID